MVAESIDRGTFLSIYWALRENVDSLEEALWIPEADNFRSWGSRDQFNFVFRDFPNILFLNAKIISYLNEMDGVLEIVILYDYITALKECHQYISDNAHILGDRAANVLKNRLVRERFSLLGVETYLRRVNARNDFHIDQPIKIARIKKELLSAIEEIQDANDSAALLLDVRYFLQTIMEILGSDRVDTPITIPPDLLENSVKRLEEIKYSLSYADKLYRTIERIIELMRQILPF